MSEVTYIGSDTVSEVVVPPVPQPVTLTARSFGDIHGLMFIDERSTDRMTITRHPVQDSADITDHAFMEPAELGLRLMATNSSLRSLGQSVQTVLQQGLGALVGAAFGPGYVKNVYDKVLALQKSRQTFTVQTGKRLYKNMLAASVELMTDEKTEHALMLTIQCKEIILVQVTTTTVPAASVQQAPQQTGGVNATGDKQPQPSTADVPYSPPT
jgi:hypothetical protein